MVLTLHALPCLNRNIACLFYENIKSMLYPFIYLLALNGKKKNAATRIAVVFLCMARVKTPNSFSSSFPGLCFVHDPSWLTLCCDVTCPTSSTTYYATMVCYNRVPIPAGNSQIIVCFVYEIAL